MAVIDSLAQKRNNRKLLKSQADVFVASILALVFKLLNGLENFIHTVWMDNYYNSPALARKRKSLGFDYTGTQRTNRQFVPSELTYMTKTNIHQGVSQWRR